MRNLSMKRFGGVVGSNAKRRADPAPTHTEKNRMACAADEQGNDKAWRILLNYNMRSQWPVVSKALTELGFTYRGYRRGIRSC